jgi:hypothetical protein
MTQQEAQAIKNEYNRYDEAFRTAKKRGDHKKASEHKAKRDALAGKLDEAIQVK